MAKKVSVTIGIPAYNEENGIGKLLEQLLKQKQDKFAITSILVASDASTDNTDQIVTGYKAQGVKLLQNTERHGKPHQMNLLFARSTAEIMVILDADIVLIDENALSRLVNPLIENPDILLSSGKMIPVLPTKYIEKVFSTGLSIWDKAIEISKSPMYLCGGPARAFRKELYKQLTFPSMSADDVFPYLYCVKIGKENFFSFVNTPFAYYRLPSTLKEYIKQSTRFLESPQIQEISFGKEIVEKNFTIGFGTKAKAILSVLFSHPILTTIYFILFLYIHAKWHNAELKLDAKWEMITSTKL